MVCSLQHSVSESYVNCVWRWRNEAKETCDIIGRRFITELAFIVAIPLAIIEIATRTIFHALNALVYYSLLPCQSYFTVTYFSPDVLVNTCEVARLLATSIFTQPFSN